jgi:type I restriction enzyme R subunit
LDSCTILPEEAGFFSELLSQVIPYQDSDLEKLYTYLRHLALKLPKRSLGKSYQFDDEIDLTYYRLQKISEGSISLADGQAKALDGPNEVGTGVPHPEQVPLSRLIDLINERFGGDLNDADQLFFDQIVETASQSEGLEQAAKVNPLDKFRLVFNQAIDALFIERMELNEELFADYMGRPELRDLISDALGEQVYKRFRETM